MRDRRLLMLCYFYPPLAGGGVHRALSFSRYLPEHGWACTVVCAGAEDYWVLDPTLTALVRPDTEVVRVRGGSGLSAWLRLRGGDRGHRSGRTFAGLRTLSDWWLMPDSYVGWSRRAARAAGDLVAAAVAGRRSRFDAVLSSSPPDSVHLAGLELHQRHRLPWVADFRDPWVGLHFRSPPSGWHRGRQAALERRVALSADVVLAASRTHAEELERREPAPGPRRVVHLPNGYEPSTAEATPPPERHGAAEDRFLVAFTGTLSQMPDTEVFLEALHGLLARRPQARRQLRACLAGPFDSDYADRALALGLNGIVEFTGPLPHGESRALQRRAQLLVLWKPRRTPTMVPGKLYEYLDAGRPLAAVLDPGEEAAELVQRAGGDLVRPGDRAGLESLIERHYDAWRRGAPTAAHRAPWLEEHSRPALAGRLARVLDALVGGA